MQFTSQYLNGLTTQFYTAHQTFDIIVLRLNEGIKLESLPELQSYKALYYQIKDEHEKLLSHLREVEGRLHSLVHLEVTPHDLTSPDFRTEDQQADEDMAEPSAQTRISDPRSNDDSFYCGRCKQRKDLWMSACTQHTICKNCAAETLQSAKKLVCPMYSECYSTIDLADAAQLMSDEDLAKLDFDYKMEASGLAVPDTFECPLCATETAFQDVFIICSHNHVSCRDCARQFFLTNVIQQNQNMTCFADTTCREEISPVDAELCLNRAEIEQLQENLFSRGTEGLTHCSRPDCSGVAEVVPPRKDFTCPRCSFKMCSLCRMDWHANMTCEEYRLTRSTTGLDRLFSRLANREGWKKCPRCKKMVERNGGCDHMTCKCGAHFCYKCGIEFRSGRPEPHNCII